MKVIFLDFDGVLNMGDYSNPWLGQARLLEGYADRDRFGLLFDAGCVGRLQRLVEATGAGIAVDLELVQVLSFALKWSLFC